MKQISYVMLINYHSDFLLYRNSQVSVINISVLHRHNYFSFFCPHLLPFLNKPGRRVCCHCLKLFFPHPFLIFLPRSLVAAKSYSCPDWLVSSLLTGLLHHWHLPLHSPYLPSAAALFLFVLLITTSFYWVNYKLEFHFQTQAALSFSSCILLHYAHRHSALLYILQFYVDIPNF